MVLFKAEGLRVSPRFHLFVSDVSQGKEGAGWVQDFLARSGGVEEGTGLLELYLPFWGEL